MSISVGGLQTVCASTSPLTAFGLCRSQVSPLRRISSHIAGNDLRHPHGKTFDRNMGVEGLQDVSRHQGVVDARVFVLFELRQLVRTEVDHGCGGSLTDSWGVESREGGLAVNPRRCAWREESCLTGYSWTMVGCCDYGRWFLNPVMCELLPGFQGPRDEFPFPDLTACVAGLAPLTSILAFGVPVTWQAENHFINHISDTPAVLLIHTGVSVTSVAFNSPLQCKEESAPTSAGFDSLVWNF